MESGPSPSRVTVNAPTEVVQLTVWPWLGTKLWKRVALSRSSMLFYSRNFNGFDRWNLQSTAAGHDREERRWVCAMGVGWRLLTGDEACHMSSHAFHAPGLSVILSSRGASGYLGFSVLCRWYGSVSQCQTQHSSRFSALEPRVVVARLHVSLKHFQLEQQRQNSFPCFDCRWAGGAEWGLLLPIAGAAARDSTRSLHPHDHSAPEEGTRHSQDSERRTSSCHLVKSAYCSLVWFSSHSRTRQSPYTTANV